MEGAQAARHVDRPRAERRLRHTAARFRHRTERRLRKLDDQPHLSSGLKGGVEREDARLALELAQERALSHGSAACPLHRTRVAIRSAGSSALGALRDSAMRSVAADDLNGELCASIRRRSRSIDSPN